MWRCCSTTFKEWLDVCYLSRRDGCSCAARGCGSGWVAISVWCAVLERRVGVLVLLAGGVDCDLNSNLTACDLLAVHVGASLLLQLLASKGDEAIATALAGLVACLELADHELWDGTESNLGGRGLVIRKELEKLLLTQVEGEVGDHDLGLGGNAIFRRATLLARTKSAALASRLCVDGDGAGLTWVSGEGTVGGFGQARDLSGDVGWGSRGRLGIFAISARLEFICQSTEYCE